MRNPQPITHSVSASLVLWEGSEDELHLDVMGDVTLSDRTDMDPETTVIVTDVLNALTFDGVGELSRAVWADIENALRHAAFQRESEIQARVAKDFEESAQVLPFVPGLGGAL